MLAAFLVSPLSASAEVKYIDRDAAVPVAQESTFTGPAQNASISALIFEIIQVLLFIIGIISVLFVILGGFRYVTASGNEEAAEGAKKMITHAIIGLVIVIMSFVIVRVISNALISGVSGVR